MIFKLVSLFMLSLVVSCGADVADNRNRSGSTTPGEQNDGKDDIEAQIELAQYLPSQNIRTRGSKIVTYDKLREQLQTGTLESTSHLIPLVSDGEINVVAAASPESDCGTDITMTVTEKRVDCKAKNPILYRWSGADNGIYGEGDWLLVMKEEKTLIWLDTNTGLIWSAVVDVLPYARGVLGDSENKPACTANTESSSLSHLASTNIKWRVPTRNDFLLADLNGSRFVLSDDDNDFWTASPIDTTTAWSIHQSTGVLSKKNQTEALSIRCVGIDLR